MGPKLQIIFTNSDKIFHPGEVVTGCVRISTNREFKCKGFLTYEGLSFVHLKGVNSRKSELDENYSTKEMYYSSRLQIIGGATANKTLTIGEHNFDFQYILPNDVPSSFESKNGYVKHYCEVNLELQRGLTQKAKCVEYLQVNSILDLNASCYRLAQQNPAVKYEVKETRYGKLSAKVKIGRTTYVPNQNIVIDAQIENKFTRVLLCMAKANLVQTVKYKVYFQSLTNHEVLCSVLKLYPTENTIDFDWSSKKLKIPQVPPSHLLGCSIMDIQYSLQFQLFSKSTSAELEVNIPIIIGSLSLQNNKKFGENSGTGINEKTPSHLPGLASGQQEYVPTQNYCSISEREHPIIPSAPPIFDEDPVLDAPPMYSEICPPTYEEAISDSTKIKD